jgi:hypothetical protein
MKTPLRFTSFAVLATALLLSFSACSSTPESRIGKNQALFQSLPGDVQQKIRAGQVEVGFTPDMTLLALGEPDRRYKRTTSSGESEVWAYRDRGPALSFGLGVGGGGGSTGVGAGVGVSTRGDRDEDKLRLVFEGGKVSSIERVSR